MLLHIYIYVYTVKLSFLAHPMVLSTTGLRHHVPGAELVELLGPLGPLGPIVLLCMCSLAAPADCVVSNEI